MRFFNKKNEEIAELKQRVVTLENQYDDLNVRYNELKQVVDNLNNSKYIHPNKIVKRGKDKKPRKSFTRNQPITKYQGYNTFKKQRIYDEKSDCFFSKTKRGEVKLNLTFIEFVEIIKEFQKGHNGNYMSQYNPLLSHFTASALQNYIYIYRAGGFNDAIKKYASKKGYNPDKLISNEVKK